MSTSMLSEDRTRLPPARIVGAEFAGRIGLDVLRRAGDCPILGGLQARLRQRRGIFIRTNLAEDLDCRAVGVGQEHLNLEMLPEIAGFPGPFLQPGGRAL